MKYRDLNSRHFNGGLQGNKQQPDISQYRHILGYRAGHKDCIWDYFTT